MAVSAIADASFLAALLSRRERHHAWALAEAAKHVTPWHSCESALSEAFFLVGHRGSLALSTLVRSGAVQVSFAFSQEQPAVLGLMRKYADVPMSLADACLVRMTELLPEPIVLTMDTDFRVYRRNGRQVVPCALPG
jgi:predicted nucleic acid-binding protein